MNTISKLTHRRFILGQQGLWPGRRFKGLRGVSAAVEQMGALQLDPLNIVVRSQHIALYGRVLGYQPEHLHKVAYTQRKLFDYGGALHLYPMSELPYWRVPMRRREGHGRWGGDLARKKPELVQEVLAAIRERGPLGNRDFEGDALKQWSYRGRKETALILYHLWLTGEIMISHRQGFDRYYDLRERVAPGELDYAAREDEAEDFFARQVLAMTGILRPTRFRASWEYSIWRDITAAQATQKLNEIVEAGIATYVKLESERLPWITLSENLPVLNCLERGEVPKIWKPLGPTTDDEVTILAPLEPASARGLAMELFDFDYVWEVYKPVEQRRWGYYTLPILYGDDLVARLDPKMDRKTNTLQILGFWLEDDAPQDEAFAIALGKGIARFAELAAAEKIKLGAMKPAKLKKQVQAILKKAGY